MMSTWNLAVEYASSAPAELPCTTCYVMADHLGSKRMLTDATGSAKQCHDFLPFGEELGTAAVDRPVRQQYLRASPLYAPKLNNFMFPR